MEENKMNDDFLDLEHVKEEVIDGPSEEEFTKAIDSLSDTDRDIFEDTGIIHIDRDMPAETQAMHVIHLQKENTKKKRKILYVILGCMVLAVIICLIGLYAKTIKDTKNATSTNEVEGASEEEGLISIDSAFTDTIFRTYVQKSFDKDGDNYLSASERNAVIMIIAPTDTALTSLQGVEYFPLLQSITFSNTGVKDADLSSNDKLTSVDCSNTPITNLVLPQDSQIEIIKTDNTSLSCSTNEDGYYNACALNQ